MLRLRRKPVKAVYYLIIYIENTDIKTAFMKRESNALGRKNRNSTLWGILNFI